MASPHQFLSCPCGLRFPGEPGVLCPMCGSQTTLAALRTAPKPVRETAPKRHLAVLIDNVRSVYNVGSIFRTADGAGVKRIAIAGISPTPEHKAMAKTALGATDWIHWSHHLNALEAADALHADGYELWALEQSDASIELGKIAAHTPTNAIALCVGNEVCGVDPELVARCTHSLSIPMRGRKDSLNVASAFAVAIYALSA